MSEPQLITFALDEPLSLPAFWHAHPSSFSLERTFPLPPQGSLERQQNLSSLSLVPVPRQCDTRASGKWGYGASCQRPRLPPSSPKGLLRCCQSPRLPPPLSPRPCCSLEPHLLRYTTLILYSNCIQTPPSFCTPALLKKTSAHL